VITSRLTVPRLLAAPSAIALAVIALVGCGSSTKTSTTTATKNTTNVPATTPTTTSPAPAPSPSASFDKEYGTFTAVTRQGSSDSVVDLPTGAKAGLVTATHTGDANFAIKDLDAENKDVDLLVNTIGAYTGTTAWGFGISTGKSVKLEITASGGWTIKLAPIGSAPVLGKQDSGKGDAVCLWTGSATNWAITNKGQGNFVVKTNGKGLLGTDLLVNEIGNYDATKPVKAGPAVTTINSDGDWTIAASGASADAETGCGASTNGGASSSSGASNTSPAPSGPGTTESSSGASLKTCGHNISVNSVTTCPFAENVLKAYSEDYKANGPESSAVVSAYSPVTKKTYDMTCASDGTTVTCTGGNNSFVKFPVSAAQ
jgi:hypothetical protein